MKHVLIGFLAIFIIGSASAQCIADFDFGIETYGSSPDPSQGEQFEPGITGEPYYDVLHLLIPTYVLEIDSTLPFSPTALLDSIELVSLVMVDLNDTLTPYTLAELGLEVVCNNNGDSNNPCSFHGGNQYCASLEGTPTMSGNFRADITVKGWTLVFGFPFGQEQLFGSLFVDFGAEGCTDVNAIRITTQTAVRDDGSCAFDNPCGLEGIEVAAISYSYTATDLTVDVGDLVYWVNYGGISRCEWKHRLTNGSFFRKSRSILIAGYLWQSFRCMHGVTHIYNSWGVFLRLFYRISRCSRHGRDCDGRCWWLYG